MSVGDYFLKLDGIDGECKDQKHKNQIDIESFSWGCSQSGSFAGGGGGGVGKVSFQDLHITKTVDASSPKLKLACASGDHIKSAILYVRKAGKEQQEFYKVTLTDVLISSYSSGGSAAGNSLPSDQISLNFAKIEYEYCPQKATGGLDAAVKAGWNLKENVKV